jgi:hypothetical protein
MNFVAAAISSSEAVMRDQRGRIWPAFSASAL